MAAAEQDIEMLETFTSKTFDEHSSAPESKSEEDDKDKDAAAGDKNDVHKADRKIGHRRVGVGGEITYKKIQTTQIMGSIQLGIQHAVGGLASKPERDLLMQDFMTVETTNFPHEGSNHTPAHHYSEFRFKTYAPIAFRYFRDLFGIQPDDFLLSMCSSPLRELSNPGASGSIFYLTEDDEFIIKTVQHKEGEFLQKLLPGYYMNLNQNPRTLLPKFFGLYCYQCNSKNVRLVAMNNLLPSVVKLHQKYDLKGSTYKRKASKTERGKKSPTYKDLDFMEHHPSGLFLEADTYVALVKTIQRDCRVLESFKIMDYSLLVGVHNLDKAQREKAEERNAIASGDGKFEEEGAAGERSMLTRTRSEQKAKEDFNNQVRRTQSINRQRLVAHSTAMESIQAESEPIDEEEDVPPGGIPARNGKGERLLLFVGVIDILQSYRFRKKLEHTWKSMIHDGDTVSVHRPSFYAQRFQDFMAKKVFTKIPSLDLPEIKGNHRKFRTLVTSYIALKHSPSKRKSISRPLKPQEDLEISGPGTSYLRSGHIQFPRVLWANPSKQKALDSLSEDTAISFRVPSYDYNRELEILTPDSRRRFSSETDSSTSRIPSPFGGTNSEASSMYRWPAAIPQFYTRDKTIDDDDYPSQLDSAKNLKLNKQTAKDSRKISFRINNENDDVLSEIKLPSPTNSNLSIAEAMKDMPFIDSIDEKSTELDTKVNDVKEISPASENPQAKKVETSSNTEKKGFFSNFKKVFIDLFSSDTSESNKNKNVDKDVNSLPSKNDNNVNVNNGIASHDDLDLSEKKKIAPKYSVDSTYFEEECSNDDFAVIPYKENSPRIVEDIEVCTDFAQSSRFDPNLEVTWRNQRRKSFDTTIPKETNNKNLYNSLRIERNKEINFIEKSLKNT